MRPSGTNSWGLMRITQISSGVRSGEVVSSRSRTGGFWE